MQFAPNLLRAQVLSRIIQGNIPLFHILPYRRAADTESAGNLGFVGFADAGYIGRESYPGGSGKWHSGAGVGLRYATAIGPIRVDFAVPTSGDDNGSNFQIYIGIGQSF